MRRRTFVQHSALVGAGLLAAGRVRAESESPLIYLSPIQSSGELSRCQAEVWFTQYENQYYVVTDASAWRAQAVSKGLTDTKIWIGDVGQWRSSKGRYRSLPSVTATAELVNDPSLHSTLLPIFGNKYADEWGRWGPRFKNGLADGSRVLLRYTATA